MRLGIDVGGTFTDLLLQDPATGRTHEAKTPSTPEDQSIGVANGIQLICRKAGVAPSDISLVLHGTTVATNAVLEGKGARVGLLVTEGFEFTLHLAKSWTPGPLFGWIVMDKPEPLASLDDTRGIPERIDARGHIIHALDEMAATRLIDDLCASGIEALTISLMHSYANPRHEIMLREIVRTRHPDIPVSLSSEILPEFREYDRTITTVINDYVRPIMRRYLSRIEDRLHRDGVLARLHIVRSDGGLMTALAASERPIHTVLSGPAGGVTSTVMLARRTGLMRLLAFDMGGTSTDVSVILNGEPTISRSTEVGSFPAKVPTLDVRSVGAGGGSIAEVSELTKSLRVGPRSAGARPGPASYGHGGTEATVSDANVVLGYLPPVLLGGEMTLDVDAGRRAVSRIGEMLGLSTENAAKGIIDIANEVMLGALRVITVERGLDPRSFGIVAFGGAGPLHANALAELLGCYPMLVPVNPGVLSAQGFLEADFKNEFVRTFIRSMIGLDPEEVWSQFRMLGTKAECWLAEEGVPDHDRMIRYSVDLRYEQQGFEVTVELLESMVASGSSLDTVLDDFHALHERLYGVRFSVPVELVALRVVASGVSASVEPLAPASAADGRAARIMETRPAFFDRAWVETPHYDRASMAVGSSVEGPAIIRQYDTTIVLLPRHYAEVDPNGNLLIWPLPEGPFTMVEIVDPITLDIIENALKNARFEMDGIVCRISLSPVIREQHDEFPMICNHRGQMVVGQFGSYIPGVVEKFAGDINDGDVFVWNDPYACKGSISHNNDWCVMMPIFHEAVLVGFSSIFGHMVDVGGKVPGSMPADARSIWEEGLRIPPVRIYDRGALNQGVLDIMLNNTRTPDMNRSDLMALIAGCKLAGTRIRELCDRFGRGTYMAACDLLLDRTREAMRVLIAKYIPEEVVSFTDYVDDDGRGNGPFKMTLSIYRRGETAVFDWTGTDDQAEGPINFHIHEGLCKLFFGVYMIMAFDPSILFNEGFYDLFEVILPEGSLLNPRFPAALSNRLNTHTRFFDCQAGALGQRAPHLSMAAGYGTSPHFIFTGKDRNGKYFQLMELLFGGVPGRPRGDGLDGHAWWPLFSATPIEYIENYYPVRVESYRPIKDSGGAGLHRGGCGVEKIYHVLEAGEVSIHDDREVVPPWGINGGLPGGTSSKWLLRAGTEVRERVKSKIDNLRVQIGDRFIFRTAGSGGWGDPLQRPAEAVARDVRRALVSAESARSAYGVALTTDHGVDEAATSVLRQNMRMARGSPAAFNFGYEPPVRVAAE